MNEKEINIAFIIVNQYRLRIVDLTKCGLKETPT